jgi:uncharacterized protein YcbK (DUF882 family)
MIGLATASTTSLASTSAIAAPGLTHRLRLLNAHTDSIYDEVIIQNGQWNIQAYKKLCYFARDWRTDQESELDGRVLETTIYLQQRMNSDHPLVLISGYRSPETNAALNGTAKSSLHMRGMAFDLRQPDRSTTDLHRAAIGLRRGGVGKYTRENFVHVDCGKTRTWGA